jgi:hypothetical protein
MTCPVLLDFIGNWKKRPEGCFQALKLLRINLRDGTRMLFPIMSIDYQYFTKVENFRFWVCGGLPEMFRKLLIKYVGQKSLLVI